MERVRARNPFPTPPTHSRSPLFTPFHLAHCSPNEEHGLCFRVHSATRGDFYHLEEREILSGCKEALSSHPNKEGNSIYFFLPFLFSLLLCCTVAASENEGTERRDERRTSLLLLTINIQHHLLQWFLSCTRVREGEPNNPSESKN